MLKHRRQVMRQIVLPLGLATFGALAVATWAGISAFTGGGSATRGAAIAIIWISIPAMLGMLILFILLAGAVYAVQKLLGITPRYTGLAQHYSLYYSARLQLMVKTLTETIIRISAWLKIFQKREK